MCSHCRAAPLHLNDTSSQPIELSVKDKRHIFRSLNVGDDVPALFEALNDQISVIDATHGDVERVAYSPLACIAGCGDVSAAKKLGSS